MKRFREFILEGRDADLYHGTDEIDNVHKILKAGKIKASANKRTSTTRDERYAREFGKGGGYFKLNQTSISHRQQIKPTDWHMGGSVKSKEDNDYRDKDMRRSESEESVKGDISLKHAHTLVVDKDAYESMTGPKTEHEKGHEEAKKKGEHYFGPGNHNTYKNRMRKSKDFHDLVKKHGLKLQVSSY